MFSVKQDKVTQVCLTPSTLSRTHFLNHFGHTLISLTFGKQTFQPHTHEVREYEVILK